MPNYLYKICFQDGSTFHGGPNIHNSKWLEIPDKPIARLEYFLHFGEGIILEGFESYFCFVEAEATIARPIGNCPMCGKEGKIGQAKVRDKKIFLARCKDKGTINKDSIDSAGLDWVFFVNTLIKNRWGEKISDNKIWLYYSEKHLVYISKIFSLAYRQVLKEAFDKKCNWIGRINELKYESTYSGDKFIYIMGLKAGMVTSYRVALNGKSGEAKYQTGDITKRILQLGKEDAGRPTDLKLWKRGIK